MSEHNLRMTGSRREAKFNATITCGGTVFTGRTLPIVSWPERCTNCLKSLPCVDYISLYCACYLDCKSGTLETLSGFSVLRDFLCTY